MRKKLSLILVLMMAIVLVAALAACNNKAQATTTPDDITPPSDPADPSATASTVDLVLTLPSKLNSVLSAMYIDEFKLSDIQWSLDYFAANGDRIETVPMGGVTDDMVSEQDREALTKKGHHIIKVSAKLDDGRTVSKSFTVHLKERGETTSLVKLWFKLDGGTSYFGSTVSSGDSVYAEIEVDASIVIDSWEIFARTFRLFKNGYVYAGVTYNDGGLRTLDANGGFPFSFKDLKPGSNGVVILTPVYSGDTITVHFDLNLPSGARYTTPEDPADMFEKAGGEYYNMAVARNIGYVQRPDTSKFDKYYGLYFAGWYTAQIDDRGRVQYGTDGLVLLDRIYNFQQTVGSEDIYLYAKWIQHEYTYTVYTMGGRFASNVTDSTTQSGETITLDNAAALGYTVIESTTSFDQGTGAMTRIIFEGMRYGDQYAKYVSEVTLNAAGDQKAVLTLADLFGTTQNGRKLITKGSDLVMRGLFSDYPCTKPVDNGDEVTQSAAAYIGWELPLNTPDEQYQFDPSDIAKLSRYFTDILFKDSYTIKADGTIRLDRARDDSIHTLVVPAYITIGNTNYNISEIGDRAFKNITSLTLVDLSRASNLTRIGDEAFANARNLAEFVQPNEVDGVENKLSVIGNDAFVSTEYENRYTRNYEGLQFIIINKVVYKFTGDPETREIDISDPENFYDMSDFSHLQGGDDTYGRVVDEQQVQGFNARLAAATHIMSGVFSRAPKLQTFRLSPNIETIEAGAFENLADFTTLDVPVTNKLKEVDRDAFEGCDTFMSARGGNYVRNTDAIMIGNIYYRQLNTGGAANLTIPGTYTSQSNKTFTITRIAAFAFGTLENVGSITFTDPENIVSIGEDAFLNTSFIRTNRNEKFTVVNGILAEYYSLSSTNVTVPDEVTTIASRAFGNYASTVITIEIGTEVERIDNYAFIGAANLRSIIMSEFTVNNDLHAVVDAPAIADSAFANAGDEFLNGVKIYLRSETYNLLATVSANPSITNDANTIAWAELFRANKDHFAIEEVSGVRLRRRDLIDTAYLDATGTNDMQSVLRQAFIDKYGSGQDLFDALAIESSVEGIAVRYDNASVNDFVFKHIDGVESDPYYEYYNQYVDRFVLGYTYQGTTYTSITAVGSSTPIILSVYKAISGTPAFDEPGSSATKNVRTYLRTKSMIESSTYPGGTTFWIEGLDGDIFENNTATFFTSTPLSRLRVRFGYRDANDIIHYVDDVSARFITVSDLMLGQPVSAGSATVTVNFYGLGTYTFTFNYAVRNAKYMRIEQKESISIPLNARGADYTSRATVNLISEDGLATPFYINNTNFTIVSVDGNTSATASVTDSLGQHVMKIRYVRTGDTLDGGTLDCDVVYTVVLRATPDLFDVRVLDMQPIIEGGVKLYDGKAYIAGYSGANAASVLSLIIPEDCVINGKTYKITAIGRIGSEDGSYPKRVFDNCPNLTTVYLPDGVETIGVNAFNGLTRLRNVRTAIKSESVITELTQTNLSVVNDKTGLTSNGYPVKFAKLENLDGVVYQKLLSDETEGENDANVGTYVFAIDNEYVITDGDGTFTYRIVEVADKIYLPERANKTADVFMYFPDTIYTDFDVYETGSDDPIDADADSKYTKVHYSVESERFYVYDRFSSSLNMIGGNAFYGCSSLNFDDDCFAESTNLFFIDDGAFAFSGLVSLDLSGNTRITEIGGSVFGGCESLVSITLPESVKLIGDNVFNGCSLLETIKIGSANDNDLSGVETIGKEAFGLCKSLSEITLGKSIVTIEDQIFRGCNSLVIRLKDIAKGDAVPTGWLNWNSGNNPVIYSGETEASDGKFYHTGENGVIYQIDKTAQTATVYYQKLSLTGDVIIPAEIEYDHTKYTVTAIGAGAFEGNGRLTSVTVSYKLATIGANAFANCVALAAFNFLDGELSENGLTNVDGTAFDGCTSLTVIPTVINSFTKDGFMYTMDRANGTVEITGFTDAEATQVVIKDVVSYAGVKYKIASIAGSAFKQATNIETVTIGANVTSIGVEAFMGCSSLNTVTVQGTSLASIGSAAFKDCSALSSFTGADNLTFVAEDAFEGCELLDPKPQA